MVALWDILPDEDGTRWLRLVPHPDGAKSAIDELDVQIFGVGTDCFHIRYLMTGRVNDVRWPDSAEPTRTDGLWRNTCFEAFLKGHGREAYREYNFSPSGAWAAYHFDTYRTNMADLDAITPDIWVDAGADWIGVEVKLIADPTLAHVNLTAVLEERDGALTYWALAHPEGPPDFHDPACFVLEIGAPPLP